MMENETETKFREGMFLSGITKMNVGFIFMTLNITQDFARQIESNISDNLKKEIQFMIMNETYIVPGYSFIYFENCVTWLTATKILTDELIENKKRIINHLISIAMNRHNEDKK